MLSVGVFRNLVVKFSDIVKTLRIVDFGVGIKYTYALISGNAGEALGIAYTPLEDWMDMLSFQPNISNTERFLTSWNLVDRSMGIAILNALSQYLLWNMGFNRKLRIEKINLIDYFSSESAGRIVVIGNMIPLIKKLREKDMDVIVLERNPMLRDKALPDTLFSEIVPTADYLIITGATLVNGTLDILLEKAKARKIALVGPTAGLYPQNLGKINILASLRILNIPKVIEIIKSGGGRWNFAEYCEDYVVFI